MFRKALQPAILIALIAMAAMAPPAPAQDADMVAKVEAALPAKATAEPAAPHKLLVFNRCRGFVHGSIPIGAKTFELMGQKTGAYEATLTEDIALFEPDTLDQFDAVLMNNTTGPVFMPADFDDLSQADQQAARERDAALKQGLLDFVRGGKGLIGIHAATDCLYEWAEYGEMMGGYFDGHPWGGGDTVGVQLDDPGHPLNAAFRGRNFKIQDEIYQIRDPYSRERLRVLLSIDPKNTDMNKGGMKRKDGDYAIAWIQRWGKGRVFYCSLGHNESVFWNPAVLRHYLDGIQFALGDLDADTTPSAKLSAGYFEKSKAELDARILHDVLAEVAAFDYGKGPDALRLVADMVIESHDKPKGRKALAKRLADILATDATLAGKQFVCRQLWRIGDDDVVPQIAPLLRDPETADMARYALERMPDADAGKALEDALDEVDAATRVGIINSLGERRDERAGDDIARFVADADPALAQAAVAALGKIGGKKALDALLDVKKTAAPEQVPTLDEALLSCAGQLLEDGKTDKATEVYEQLYAKEQRPRTRAAALKGWAAAMGPQSVFTVIMALLDESPLVRAAAADAMRTVPGAEATEGFAAALFTMQPDAQLLILHALADRGDRAALPAIANRIAGSDVAELREAALDILAKHAGDADVPVLKDTAESDDTAVLLAAVAVLGQLGDTSVVPMLAKASAAQDQDFANAALASLALLKGEDIDQAIVQAMDGADAHMRVQLIRCLADRYAHDTVPALLKSATDENDDVRSESFKALRTIAIEKDLPAVVELMIGEANDAVRRDAEAAVVSIAKRVEEPDKRAAAALAAFPGTEGNIPGRCSLVRVLGKLGDDSTLEPLRADLKSDNAELNEAAIRALAEWRTPAPLSDLYDVASSGPSDVLRAVALRAYLRLLTVPSDRTAADTVQMYEQGLELATTVEEKKMALGGLADVPDQSSVELIKKYEGDAELKDEVALALEKAKNRGLTVTASHGAGEAGRAIDGDVGSRWTTGTPMRDGMWFQIDLGWELEVVRLVLDAASSSGDYPRGYKVYVSSNTENWGEPVAEGQGDKALVEINCEPKRGRYVRIVQTGAQPNLYWSIHELEVETSL